MTDYEILNLVSTVILLTANLIVSIILLVLKIVDYKHKKSYPSSKEK